MLESVFGNETLEKVLFFLRRNKEGYALGIADKLGLPVSQVQRQLERMEKGGVLVSRLIGRTRVYELDPRWAFKNELSALLDAAMNAVPVDELVAKYTVRNRPRRKGKN